MKKYKTIYVKFNVKIKNNIYIVKYCIYRKILR